ncbi:hypothetical protein WV31_08885 [Magnetospirillum sp. ME-1]|uniref:DUF1127 domain-containing protein n=1 Tax=Magnetospirillum sp. ME-1 TaxID=1639348 RepID=UPI000A179D56|nr:DUF1127 domain-containing protein [Magnetospirillum sp. ME-1]ARJ65763.1 hypothetical protein WV31_08885 [Magnetospirillum sp. ME-1]
MSLSPTIRPCASSSGSEGRSLLGLAASFLDRRIVAPLALRFERTRLRDELAGLDHRELKDIGITDVDSFVAGWRPNA